MTEYQHELPFGQPEQRRRIREEWGKQRWAEDCKIVVIDDDPTGTQTVYNVPVYTHWDEESLCCGLKEDGPIFYVLTNSRGMGAEETKALHQKLGADLMKASRKSGRKFLLISRGDSTLRGHYPLETHTLAQALAQNGGPKIDGEILIPFFGEGKRYTIDDIHYVLQEDRLVPAGETEFARDKTFFYHSSDLKEWIEEKTKGKVRREQVISFSLEQLRSCSPEEIAQRLLQAENFAKIIVNAVCEEDLMAFACGFVRAAERGKHFLFHSAASLPKVLAQIETRPPLRREEMIGSAGIGAGLVIVGSHVKKSTDQLACLLQMKGLGVVEFNQHLILKPGEILEEQERAAALCSRFIREGKTAVVYTRRERFDVNSKNPEDELRIAVQISEALTGIIRRLQAAPAFVIAKGGITSSDIAVKGLGIRRALVMGQILPGVPVWKGDSGSLYAGVPYVVFPGNVGGKEDLRKAVEILQGEQKPIVAMLMGDGSGVGPELTAKLAKSGVLSEGARPLVIGDARLWELAVKRFAAGTAWKLFQRIQEVDWEHGIPVVDVGKQDPDKIHFGQADGRCGAACLEMLEYAVSLFRQGLIQGLCYGPLNKQAMKLAHSPAASETEFLAALLGQDKGYGEINMLDGVWTTRVTSHIPISAVSDSLTEKKVEESIELADETLKRAGFQRPRIGVCALNPHAGEGGLCGDEEIRIIAPAVEAVCKRGIMAKGPFAADTLFKQAFDGKFEAIVTMYHDQGQIALKLWGFERGITIGGGLALPTATCAHGTAHDIAWKGDASPLSLERAYRMVCTMAQKGFCS